VPLHVHSARAIAADAPLPPQGVNSAGKKILIVDDNVDAALTLSELLQMWGYQTRVVHDAPAALELLAASAVDIALLDIGLPVMDGYELAHRIRNGGSGNGIRLIALTGYGQAAAQKQSWNSGFDAHLVKPVDLDKLVDALSPA
jgi:CheY-like chemotaxis protein